MSWTNGNGWDEEELTPDADDREGRITYDLACGARRLQAYGRCAALADGQGEQVAYWEAAIGQEQDRLARLRQLLGGVLAESETNQRGAGCGKSGN